MAGIVSYGRQQQFQQTNGYFPKCAAPKLDLPAILNETTNKSGSHTDRPSHTRQNLPILEPALTSRPVQVMQKIIGFSSFDPFKQKTLPQDIVFYLDLLENKVPVLNG